ncbi:influenza virus NS1A-binding protein homolog [Lytechinus pictus]|uniref:influenza virus NS1A-binding protein homolog n=1 Tax=Lytechinus pictus TaxID=7653 RepID=UPI00240E162E|nr:influenza virus NS1A-binding protein homolog [Lytechinus pictus]
MNKDMNSSGDDELLQMKKKFSEMPLQYGEDQWPASVLACMNEMRKQHQFHDLVLLTDEHEIPAHGAVLACMSPFFSEVVNREEKRRSGVLKTTVDGVSAATIEALVNFAYTGKIEVCSELVSEVYHVAKEWKVPRLKKACATHMLDNMNTRNCLEIRSLATTEGDEELISIVDQFIKGNVDEITSTSDFCQLPFMKLEVISNKSSISLSDRQIFEAAVEWVRRTMKGGIELSELISEPQTLLLSGNNLLKNITEVDELSSEVMDTYDIDVSKVGVYTPDKKSGRVGHQNGSGNGHSSNGSTTPRKLIMTPGDAPKQSKVAHKKWKVIASTSMADEHYVALTVLDNQLATLVLYEKRIKPKHKHRPSRSFSIEKDALHPTLSSMKLPRCAVGIAEFKGRLIVAGGYNQGKFHSTVEAFDPTTNKWEFLSRMYGPRGRFQLCPVNGVLLAIGGSDGNCELKSCESFDTLTKWVRAPDMPGARTCFGATMVDNKVYVIGGASGSQGTKDCLRYDPSSSTWSSIAPLNEGRAQVGVCSARGHIYAIGGSDAWNCYNSVEVYHPDEDQWKYLSPMKTCRRGAGTCTLEGKVYAVGGSDGQTVLDTVECYDHEREEWAPVASMATPRVNVGVGVIDGKIYAVGGFSGKEFLNSVELYDPMQNRWYQTARHLRAPVTASPPLSPVMSSPHNGAAKAIVPQEHSNGNGATSTTNGKSSSTNGKIAADNIETLTLPVA